MKKSSIMSLLLVFSVLVSCAFHLSVCAEETAPPDTASVSTTEEAPAQPAAEPVSNPAPIHIQEPASNPGPEPTAAPTSSAQSAANPAPESVAVPIEPEQPVTNPAPEPVPSPAANPSAETSVSPAANPSPESVAESAAVSSTDPDTEPTVDSPTDPVTEPMAESTAAPVKSDGDTPVATESPISGGPASGDTVWKDKESRESSTLSTDMGKNTSQNNIHAVEFDEPDARTGMHTAEDNADTYSITLRNQVYIDNVAAGINLSALFQLSIQKSFLPEGFGLDWFKALFPEGASTFDDQDFYIGEITLQNKDTHTLQGIPSTCPVKADYVDPECDYYRIENGRKLYFSESFIVGKEYNQNPGQTLKAELASNGNIEYSYLRFPEQDDNKLFIINDSDGDDPLELTVDVDGTYIFVYSDESDKSDTPITLAPDGNKTITLLPGEYGYLMPDGIHSPAAVDLSGVKKICTPVDMNVTAGVSSFGNYDDSANTLTPVAADSSDGIDPDENPTYFALFRAEKPKTDTNTPKTDDEGDPGTDPGNPDPENDPGTPAPGTTPGSNPGTTDPGKDTPVSTSTTSSPRKNKKSPDTDQPSADTAVSQKTPAAGMTSAETDAVDTADRTPIALYVLLMLTALVIVMIVVVKNNRYCRR